MKPQASLRKSTRKAVARNKGKSSFNDVSIDGDDPNFMAEKIYRRRARRHISTTKKLKHTRHMLRQLTMELQTITEIPRRVVKLLAKVLIKTDRELRICQER